ncbi:MAG: hypothetical protein ABSC48_01520 [Terracidiphilus sp.]|jgi:hypothetical protein
MSDEFLEFYQMLSSDNPPKPRLLYRLSGSPFASVGISSNGPGWSFENDEQLFQKVSEVFGNGAVSELKQGKKFRRYVHKDQLSRFGR